MGDTRHPFAGPLSPPRTVFEAVHVSPRGPLRACPAPRVC